jgi:hypothetical protein
MFGKLGRVSQSRNSDSFLHKVRDGRLVDEAGLPFALTRVDDRLDEIGQRGCFRLLRAAA